MTDNTGTRGILNGLKALVVGATGGIGLSVVRAVAAAGADIVAHGRDEGRLAAVAAELRGLGAGVSTICADLSAGEAPETLLVAASDCDIVVVAYGPFVQKPLAATTGADWRLTALCCLALPGAIATRAATGMAARGFGRILLFGGTRTDAIRGFKTNAAYAAAKTGLGVLAKSIAAEFAGRGVSCAVVCPGFMDTEYLSPETKDRLAAASPRGGLIPAPELAELVLHLVSGGMDLANGSIIVADRGLYAL